MYVAVLGTHSEDPLVDALQHGPLSRNGFQRWLPFQELLRVAAFFSVVLAASLGSASCWTLFHAWASGVAGSLLWGWLFLFVLLQAAVLPSRLLLAWKPHLASGASAIIAPATDGPESVVLARAGRLAGSAGELMYGWLIIGVVIRFNSAPDVYPWLRSMVGWVLALAFARSAIVDIFQLMVRHPQIREMRYVWEDELEGAVPDSLEAGDALARRRSVHLTKVKHNCQDCGAGGVLNSSCPICLSDFDEGSTISRLPCKHAFHGRCIKKWLRKSSKCPLCMQAVGNE